MNSVYCVSRLWKEERFALTHALSERVQSNQLLLERRNGGKGLRNNFHSISFDIFGILKHVESITSSKNKKSPPFQIKVSLIIDFIVYCLSRPLKHPYDCVSWPHLFYIYVCECLCVNGTGFM